MGIIKSIMGGAPKQPNLAKQQEAAARAERDKIATENAAKDNQALKKSEDLKSKRQQFASALTPVEDDETQRRRYLAGA